MILGDRGFGNPGFTEILHLWLRATLLTLETSPWTIGFGPLGAGAGCSLYVFYLSVRMQLCICMHIITYIFLDLSVYLRMFMYTCIYTHVYSQLYVYW